MQGKIDYNGITEILSKVGDIIYQDALDDITNDCASISKRLNEIGLQSVATNRIDECFMDMYRQLKAAMEYMVQLYGWVNKYVIGDYRTLEGGIGSGFANIVEGKAGSNISSLGSGGYGRPDFDSPNYSQWNDGVANYYNNLTGDSSRAEWNPKF